MSTSEPIPPLTLTADDVAAMRAASSYVVRLEGDHVHLDLTCRVRPRAPRGFTLEDQYARPEGQRRLTGAAHTVTRGCFVQVYPTGAWQALTKLVRPGDVVRFYALEDNSNDYLRAAVIPPHTLEHHGFGYARLYLDELCVDVTRGRKTVLHGLTLCHSLCPQNSARAIRPADRRDEWEVA